MQSRSTWQAINPPSLQRGAKSVSQLKPKKKFEQIFVLSLAVILISTPLFGETAGLTPPRQFGLVVDSYRLPAVFQEHPHRSAQPVIVHIQDAHQSVEIQRNIAGIVRWLVKNYGFRVVVEEGNSGLVETESLFWFSRRGEELKGKLAERFLQEGKITGAEQAQILDPGTFTLYGAEDKGLYSKNLRIKNELAFYQHEIRNELLRRQKTLKKQSLKVFSKDLRHYLDRSEKFWKGKGLPPFELSPSSVALDKKGLKKLEKLDTEGRDSLIRDGIQADLLEKIDLLKLLLKLSELRATREDIHKYQDQLPGIRGLIGDSLLLQEFFEKVEKFYYVAAQRDLAMIQNTLKRMMSEGTDRVILISGGFHTEGISGFLRQSRIAYAVIAPLSGARGDTLREPNLFNLPAPEGRLMVDLKALQALEGTSSPLYEEIKQDARALWKRSRVSDSSFSRPLLPVGLKKNETVVVLPVGKVPPREVLRTLTRWMASVLESHPVEFVLTFDKEQDARSVHRFFNDYFPDKSVRQRVSAVRLLTASDYGTVKRLLYGKSVCLLGQVSDKDRLRLSGLRIDEFVPYALAPRKPVGQEAFLDELNDLQKVYRQVVISS